MIYVRLFLSFVKIGLFSFGGGYAMIPLLQSEIEAYGWLSASEFADIIAIAEMTPGPIAVNSATFVGFRAAGFWGGLAATIGVATPSLILILIIAQYFFRFQKHPLNTLIFYGIRPVIAGLIASAAFFVAETAIWKTEQAVEAVHLDIPQTLQNINLGSIAIFAMVLLVLMKYKLHPILVIVVSSMIGIVFYLI